MKYSVMVTNVIVIGAGLSGLSAALLLVEQGYSVLVLEARDRVGGRTYTIRDKAYGGYTDVGGAYVGPTQRRVARLAKRFGLEFYKVDVEHKTVINIAEKWYDCEGTVPPIYNPITALDVNNLQRTLESMSKLVPADAPWSAKNAHQWDNITLKEYVDKTCWTEFGRKLVAYACRAVLCVEMHELSLLAFLWYMSSGQGFQRVVNVTNGAQESKFVGGSQQLSESMAAFLKDCVHLSSPVIRVDQTQDLIKVHTSVGEIFESEYVISAVPLALLNRITFEPSLPANKLQLIQRMPMGSIIKTLTFYDKQYWKLKGLSGQMETDNGPVMDSYDDTKPDGSAPCLMGFILANQARSMACMTADERKKAVASHYAEKFQCPELLNPINYVEKNWCDDEYSGGCYVSTFPPGVLTQFGPEIRRPFQRVYIAGTESATYWAGYMEGAIQAGERAAREVLNAMGRIPASEIWQNEPQLPEFPEPPIESSFFENILPTVPNFLAGCVTVTVGTIALAISKIASRL